MQFGINNSKTLVVVSALAGVGVAQSGQSVSTTTVTMTPATSGMFSMSSSMSSVTSTVSVMPTPVMQNMTMPGTNGTSPIMVTKILTAYTTYCPGPTTFAMGNKTYTVTEATTLTILDCPCTVVEPLVTPESPAKPTNPLMNPDNGKNPPGYVPGHDVPGNMIPANPTSAVVVGAADARSIAYGLAMAAAGVVGAVAL